MTITEQPHKRPRTRGECPPVDKDLGWRLCPFAGCRHHLYLEVYGATVVTLDGDLAELATQRPMCSLDVVDIGGTEHDPTYDGRTFLSHLMLSEIADLLCVSRQRVDQIVSGAMKKVENDAMMRAHAHDNDLPMERPSLRCKSKEAPRQRAPRQRKDPRAARTRFKETAVMLEMKRRSMSCADLARASGCSTSTASRAKLGQGIRDDMAWQIGQVLGIDVKTIMGGL